MNFEEANQVVHKIEDQWHYPILTRHGWFSATRTAVGFVRSYNYHHSTLPNKITATTGYSSDHWEDLLTHKFGFWSDLEPYLRALVPQE